ncbi:MAG: TOBE domain-containing protein [Planctomycetaceae bacterium]|nr:TOBE domain-containing protein [Planctomycetaceae bacterium]
MRNHLAGTITALVPEGPLVRVSLHCGFDLTALVTRPACEELHLCVGDRITALLKGSAVPLIPRE